MLDIISFQIQLELMVIQTVYRMHIMQRRQIELEERQIIRGIYDKGRNHVAYRIWPVDCIMTDEGNDFKFTRQSQSTSCIKQLPDIGSSNTARKREIQ